MQSGAVQIPRRYLHQSMKNCACADSHGHAFQLGWRICRLCVPRRRDKLQGTSRADAIVAIVAASGATELTGTNNGGHGEWGAVTEGAKLVTSSGVCRDDF